MPKLTVIRPSGAERELEGDSGMTLMEIMRHAGIEDILAICGGSCSCATCHVHVEGGPTELLPAMNSDEDDVLDGSFHRGPTSRLACQIRFAPQLDGLRVRIVPEE